MAFALRHPRPSRFRMPATLHPQAQPQNHAPRATRGLGLRFDDAGARTKGAPARSAHKPQTRPCGPMPQGRPRRQGTRSGPQTKHDQASGAQRRGQRNKRNSARSMTAPQRARGACGHGGGSEKRPRKRAGNARARRGPRPGCAAWSNVTYVRGALKTTAAQRPHLSATSLKLDPGAGLAPPRDVSRAARGGGRPLAAIQRLPARPQRSSR